MALFTDSNISTLDHLRQYDSSILDVSKTEGIELSSKMAIAENEIALELQAFLLRHQSWNGVGEAPYNLNQVVVTPALRHWHTLKTLELVYSDVYNSQLNDRYLGKSNMFRRLCKNTAELFFQTGIGIVFQPLPRAQAPLLANLGPGGAPSGTYLVSIAWKNADGDHGASSDPRVFEAPGGELMLVDAGAAPPAATAFDVYAGFADGELALQTPLGVPAGSPWSIPESGLILGYPPSDGQSSDIAIRLQRILQRG